MAGHGPTPAGITRDARGSLRLLFIPVVLIMLGTLAFQIAGEVSAARRRIERESTAFGRAMLAHSAANVARQLARGDRAGVETEVSRLGALPGVTMAALLDPDGRVVTANRWEWRGQPAAQTALAGPLAAFARAARGPVAFVPSPDGPLLVAAGPVDGRGTRRLVFAMDLAPAFDAVRAEALAHTGWGLVLRLVALVLLWVMLERRILKPASRMAQAARRFGAGDLDARTGLGGMGELAGAGLAFDRMAARIQAGEHELRRTRGLIDGLLRSLPVGVIAVERRTLKLLFVNPQWAEFYGTPLGREMDYPALCEGVGLERPDGSPFPIHALSVATVLHTGRPAQIDDLVVVRADGSRIPLMCNAVPVNIGGGPEFDTVVCVAQDRRELERAFRELRDWEQRFETVIGATGQVVYDWDVPVGRVRRSGSVMAVLGNPDRDARDGLAQWRAAVHPDDLPRVEAQLEEALARGEVFDAEYRYRHADGRWILIRDRGIVRRDADGRAVRLLGAMLDVTERRNLEQQLRHAQKMETVGTLAGGIAHDFNNQLTGVMGHLDLLGAELPPDDARQEHVRVAYQAAERCAELTSGLLAFSRRLASRPRPAALNATVGETAALLRRMLPATVRLTTVLEPELWTAHADPGQIQQVLMNLCVNARDAMPDGGTLALGTRNVTLEAPEAARHPGAHAGEFVELEVEDSGCGIATDVLPRIFEPFFTTKPVGAGTGLGLAMVYGIVSAHHGWVEIDSAVGRGSTFRVYLPRAQGAPADVRVERRQAPRGGRETVLVVDDEAAVRDLAARTLAGAGYQVVCAHHGDEAVAIARARRALEAGAGAIQAVLLDLTMPGLPGRIVLEQLRALDPGIRIILSSGFASDIPAAPGVEFLPKPYAPGALLDLLRTVLDRPQAGEARLGETIRG